MAGTNFFASKNATVDVSLTDGNDNAILAKATIANIPTSAAGYAIGCEFIATDTGNHYLNTGTASSATWTLIETGATSLQLPEAATDATTTTTTSLALTQNAVTSGIGLSQALNGLTTGQGHLISHTTAVIADTGSLLRVTSSSIDTGGATNGTLLDLKSTGQLAGTTVRLDNILTTGTAMSIIGTGVMTTTGNLLTLTANSATTAAGLLRINANGLTDGIGAVIASSATAMTATGRLLSVSHSGATSASGAGILAEVSSAATDATTILKVTASAALAAGTALQVSGAAVTTGTLVKASNADALTTGTIANFTSNSSDVSARKLVQIINDNTAAVATVPLYLQQDAVGTTHFKTLIMLGTIGIYVSDETTPNAALTAAKGSICLNGSATGQAYWNTDGSTAWTALA